MLRLLVEGHGKLVLGGAAVDSRTLNKVLSFYSAAGGSYLSVFAAAGVSRDLYSVS